MIAIGFSKYTDFILKLLLEIIDTGNIKNSSQIMTSIH